MSTPAPAPVRKRILVVEDEGIVVRDICDQLTVHGYEPIGDAPSGERGIELTAILRPDLVLMDISLAGEMDGITAAQLIRERFRVPVVFLTAYSGNDTLERVKEAEPFGYITKPFEEQDLRVVIEMAIFKHQTEMQLRSSEARYRALTDSAAEAIVTIDQAGKVVSWNRGATRIFGYAEKDILRRPMAVLIPERTWPGEPPATGRDAELTGWRQNGSVFPLELSLSQWDTPEGSFVTGIIRDITERRVHEEELKASRSQLQVLASRLQATREEESSRIARTVHDELGQLLTGLKMDLRWIEHGLEHLQDPRTNPILEKVVTATELVDATVKTVQRIAYELRPAILDKLGLFAALKHEAGQFQLRSGTSCRFLGPEREVRLPPEMGTACYRIVQEALVNVARHAGASEVEIEYLPKAAEHIVEVRDNGRGLAPHATVSSTSLGLLGMQERARPLGGSVSIATRPEGGTVVRLRLPCATGREEAR